MLYIANWKMNLSFNEAISFCKNHYNDLITLSQDVNKKIILCPSFVEITQICNIFKDSAIEIGAQNCSHKNAGAYTGQILAKSLHEAGCTYCIVGHSERRIHCFESNELIIQKTIQALKAQITPIVCIGETEKQYISRHTKDILKKQLKGVIEAAGDFKGTYIHIAYEPVWAIGTGKTPTKEYIQDVFSFILEITKKYNKKEKIKLLYGGSVNDKNILRLKSIDGLEGFLIGSTSLDFKKFEKIVQL